MSNSFGFGWTNGWLVFRRVGGRGAGGTKHFERPLRHPILRIAYRKARLIPDARHPTAPARHRPPGPAPAVARALSAAARVGRARHRAGALGHRSEAHTSELQSLMRISYAVFCLKKKHITSPNTSA